jgi:hypothetical protein
MRYVHHLSSSGTPLPDQRGYLALWWNNNTAERNACYTTTWGTFTATSKNISLGLPNKYEAHGFIALSRDLSDPNNPIDVSPALVLNGERMLALLTQQNGCCGAGHHTIRHVPYADGIGPAATAHDHNDGDPIRKYLCQSLRCQAACENFNTSCTKSSLAKAGMDPKLISNPGTRVGPCKINSAAQ